MKSHEVIIGTRHEATCAPELAAAVGAIFTRHGFDVHENVAGYTGGNIVATFGQPRTRRVHALQLEVNAALLMTTSRDEFIAHISRGGIPEKAAENIARLRRLGRSGTLPPSASRHGPHMRALTWVVSADAPDSETVTARVGGPRGSTLSSGIEPPATRRQTMVVLGRRRRQDHPPQILPG